MEAIEKQIEIVLDKIRPFLQREGGNVEYVGYKDGVVYVNMVGACEGCAYADADISQGIETILVEEVPGVIRCDSVMSAPLDILDPYLKRKEEQYKKLDEEK
ncbi:MAG: NifU family protein [Bacilli bacterium]|nr:NifU family protein [Bacilli bacterium]MBR6056339.1 NifU family protein [Bacilli bacterium]